MGMFELLLNKYNISFNEVFEIREIKTNRLIGHYYFIKNDTDVFSLCKKRKCSTHKVTIVSSSMTGDLLVGLMKNKITIVKTNETIK